MLIFKLFAVDADHTGTVTVDDVATLNHELVNDPVQRRFYVGQAVVFSSAQLAKAAGGQYQTQVTLLSLGEQRLLLACPGCLICEELNDKPPSRRCANVDIQENPRSTDRRHSCAMAMNKALQPKSIDSCVFVKFKGSLRGEGSLEQPLVGQLLKLW